MDTANKQKPLTNRWITVPTDPTPISPIARAADLAEYAKKHKVYQNASRYQKNGKKGFYFGRNTGYTDNKPDSPKN
jgi:hypothetical protein